MCVGCRILDLQLVESTFARAVAKIGDKAPKRIWKYLITRLARQTARQMMDPHQRGSPMFTLLHAVYESRRFARLFRGCKCVPPCTRASFSATCTVCREKNRRTASQKRERDRASGAHAQSIRNMRWKRAHFRIRSRIASDDRFVLV